MADLLDRLQLALAERYRIVRELGRGGMAVVYLARDERHDRDVALKVLLPEIAGAVGVERFLREVRVSAGLSHPHILMLHESGEADGLPYFVMPYVEGESLRDRISREGALPVPDAIRIASEVADALAHAHARGLVHRDIKPENILLSGGHAIVADFGIARAIDEAGGQKLTSTGLAIGTPAYMSPEQWGGDSSRVDGRSDIYALGCVLYEMLVGEPPFSGPNPMVILARHSMEAVPSIAIARPGIPPALENVVHQAMAKVAADRFATAREMRTALESLHAAHVSVSRDAGTLLRGESSRGTGRWSRRRVLAYAAAGLLAVAALGATVAHYVNAAARAPARGAASG